MGAPSFEVIADTATLNLVMVEGASMNAAFVFTDLETSAAENWSGVTRADMYIYSGSGSGLYMQLSSSGISGASGTLTVAVNGILTFNKFSSVPAAGTYPYTTELTWSDGAIETIMPPALLKVIPKYEGTYGND